MTDDGKKQFDLDAPADEANPGKPEAKGAPSATSPADHDDDYAAPERFANDRERLENFLKYPENKRELARFLQDTYKQIEKEAVDRSINRSIYQHHCDTDGSPPHHRHGHIGALVYEYLNMRGVENAFVSGLQHTKSSMTKTVQQRVDEINTLLRGVGGFNRQIKASLSRSAILYLEQEDPRCAHRERVIFTVNVADCEMKTPMDVQADSEYHEDGRSIRRFSWDQAINTLAEIVSNTGMKPKYVKNDKNSYVFKMSQYLIGDYDPKPDEYFDFELKYFDEEMREAMKKEYISKLAEYDVKIKHLNKKLNAWTTSHKSRAFFESQLAIVESDRDFYVGTTPDPREMDSGLIFSIHANTMKDYNITKDKMQVIMTRFILAMSDIAMDKSMDEQVNTDYSKESEVATKTEPDGPAPSRRQADPADRKRMKRVVMKDDLKKAR